MKLAGKVALVTGAARGIGRGIALALAGRRMAKRSVIVRRLAAVEGLGSCTLIATDKTGTLTRNELTATEARLPDGRRLEITGGGYVPEGSVLLEGRPLPPGELAAADRLARAAVLCNEATLHRAEDEWTWHGDPTEVALAR